jgi:hypothetical protein
VEIGGYQGGGRLSMSSFETFGDGVDSILTGFREDLEKLAHYKVERTT